MTIENPQRDALASFNFAQKYARYLPELKRRETWSEATARVMSMHRTKLGERAEELSVELEEIELLINEHGLPDFLEVLEDAIRAADRYLATRDDDDTEEMRDDD